MHELKYLLALDEITELYLLRIRADLQYQNLQLLWIKLLHTSNSLLQHSVIQDSKKASKDTNDETPHIRCPHPITPHAGSPLLGRIAALFVV
jgi:hypothetical protein